MSSHVLHLVRSFFGLPRKLSGGGKLLLNAPLDSAHDGKGDPEARYHANLGRAGSVDNVASERYERHAVDDPKLGDDVARYGDHLRRIGHGSINLSDANSRAGAALSHSLLHNDVNRQSFAQHMDGVER